MRDQFRWGGQAVLPLEVEARPEALDRRVIGDAVGVVQEKADPEARSLASLLIAKGQNVVFVSRQLGHTKPATTLSMYGHLFERTDHAQAAREGLEASHAATVAGTRRIVS